jgi:hypothetical protein
MSAARSYIPPVEISEVMRPLPAARMIASRHPRFHRVPGFEPRRSYLDT